MMSMYSRVRPMGLSNFAPCQPSETCGPDTPRPSRNRPPDSVSRVAAVIAVIAGVRAGICITALPRSMRCVWPAIQASIVTVSEPYDAGLDRRPDAAHRPGQRGDADPGAYPGDDRDDGGDPGHAVRRPVPARPGRVRPAGLRGLA